MTHGRRHPTMIMVVILILATVAACSAGTGGTTPTASTVVATPIPAPVSSPAGTGRPSPESSPPITLDQAWATAELVDVSTGATFRIADHAGKVIVIETMAIWCSNCRVQQGDVKAALERLPADSVVYVVLDVDPNEDGASLSAYRDKNSFVGRYAIAGATVARALAAEFGDQFLNPPSTPMAVVGTDGIVTLTGFGHKSPDEIVALAKAHGA